MIFFKNIYNKFICANPKDYDLGIDVEINKILFFLALGLCAACIVINYCNSKTAIIVKKLIRAEAFTEDNAKTLAFLGLSDNKGVIRILSKEGGVLKRMVCTAGEQKLSYEEYIALEKQKKLDKRAKKSGIKSENEIDEKNDLLSKSFYIPYDMKNYSEEWLHKNDTSMIKTILFCLLILAFYIAILFLMPSVLSLISDIIAK